MYQQLIYPCHIISRKVTMHKEELCLFTSAQGEYTITILHPFHS